MRCFVIVLDSLGAGEAPDADRFGDVGANTLRRISGSPAFSVPNLIRLGIGHLDGVGYLEKTAAPTASWVRLQECSMGKDTTTGHFELAGLLTERPLPTYPHGFPREVMDAFSAAVGRGVLCNLPCSGTEVIRDYGEEHLRTGKLIVYTSADSVFQIAAHEDLIPPEDLYAICRIARRILTGEHAVGRVIARPFTGKPGSFVRTANRRDFSLEPPGETMLDALKAAGKDVIAVGKITDIFAGRGITESVLTHGNTEGIAQTIALADRDFDGLCFVNLVDFDMLYGHRQDVDGYAAALSEFDRNLPALLSKLRPGDVLMLTADHGCDPGDDSTDHTREYVPLMILGAPLACGSLGTEVGFGTLADTVCGLLGVPYRAKTGCSLLSK